MALRGVALTVHYVAWNTLLNAPKAGDVANHTLALALDGVSLLPANSPFEIDSGALPGVYSLALTADETEAGCVTVGGSSSTTGVVILPVTLTTEGGFLEEIEGKTGLLGSGGATVPGPWTSTGNLVLKKGDAYTVLANRPIDFQLAQTWLPDDISGAEVSLYIGSGNVRRLLVEGAVVTPTGPIKVVRAELPQEEVARLEGPYQFDLELKLDDADESVVTPSSGTLTVESRIR